MSRYILLTGLSVALAVARTVLAAPGPAGCGTGSWIGGTSEICDGVFIHRDYVYDDYGSRVGDPNAPNPGSLSGTNGKVRYTADINSADLVGLRLWIDGGQLRVRFELNTLRDVNSTFGAIAIDTDNDTGTGAGIGTDSWANLCATEQPHGSGACTVPLRSTGWEVI
ncbi:MAG: hypothetical protein ACREI7_10525, partial [Myxococcota bacterium]